MSQTRMSRCQPFAYYYDDDTTVAVREDDHGNEEVGEHVPGVDDLPDGLARPDEIRQTDAVLDYRRDKHDRSDGENAASSMQKAGTGSCGSGSDGEDAGNPGEHHRCIYHPALEVLLAPERMDDLQVALDRHRH